MTAGSLAVAAPTRARHVVVALTLLLVGVAYLDRVCISTASVVMQADLGLDDRKMGIVFSAFTLTYGLFEMPSGWMADRFGARVTLARIVIFWSAMTAATGLVAGFASLVLVRLLFGMGEAGAFPATARAYARWLPEAERGRAFGLAIMTGALSAAATQPLVVKLLSAVGWRGTFAIFGGVGILWTIAWVTYFRDDPKQHRRVNEAELALIGRGALAPDQAHGSVPWGTILRSRTVLALCLMYSGTIYGWYFYLTWLPKYLLRARGFDMKQMGWLSSGPLLGIALGVSAGGLLSDALPRLWGKRVGRRVQGLVGLPLAGALVVLAIVTRHPLLSVLLFSGAAMFAALGVAPAWAVCVEIGGPHAGVVSGAMNTFGNLGGSLCSYVIGEVLARYHSWGSLYTIAGLYGVAAACWLFVDPDAKIAAG